MDNMNLQIAQRGVITIPKALRDAYGLETGDWLTLVDLGGVFVLSPRPSEIDALADAVAAQWSKDGQTLESMLAALRAERDKRG